LNKKFILSLIVTVFSVVLSGCVTQEFENDETPVIKNQSNNDEMAATRISLGLGYLKMGNMPQAKQNLEKAKRFSPDMVQVHTAFAHYYETVGESELAITSFEKALSIKSDDADTLNNYGVFLCRQGEIDAAEKQLLKAIAVPSYVLVAKSYENLSSCFLQEDNFVKAEKYLYKAVMHSPGNASILFQMIRLQYAMGEFIQAKVYEQRFEKVTRRFTPQSLALAYKVYLRLRQHRTAKNYGTMLVKMYPQSWEAQQYLLNELELIEADNLAKRYKLTQLTQSSIKSKKRIVKLSPKKAALLTQKNNLPENKKPKYMSTNHQVFEVSKVATSLPAVDTSAITKQFNQTQVETINQSNKNKRVIVLEAPRAERNSVISHQSSKIHVVGEGDTLYSISVKYNIRIQALRRWNNISDKRKIRVNDQIYLIDPQMVNK
jgi:type IV pilus assembly protein PilF